MRRPLLLLLLTLSGIPACRPAPVPATAPAPSDATSPISYPGVTPSGRLASGEHSATPPAEAPTEPVAEAVPPSASPPSPTGPRWACDKPIVDLGDLWENKVVPLSFELRSVGGSPLHLLDVKSSCHCTAAKNWPREIATGTTGAIAVTFSTQNMNGPVVRTLDITTDDYVQPLIKFTVKANVKTLITVEPRNGGVFANFPANQPLHRVVRLKSNIESPISLELIPAANRSIFAVQFKEAVPGREFDLTIDAAPPIPEGSSATQLRFKTSSPDVPIYTMNVSAYVAPRLAVNPPKVVIDPPKPMDHIRQLRLVNNGPTPVHITSIASSEPRLALRLRPADPKKPNEQVIDFTVPAGYQPPPHAEAFEIRTDDAEKPVFVIPVQPSFANPRPRPPDRPLIFTPVSIAPVVPATAP